jgi:hypothetical protein
LSIAFTFTLEIVMGVLRFSRKFSAWLVIGLSIACAILPRLDVTYKTLPTSNALEDKELYLEVTDKRPARDIIGPGAKRVFKDFAGNITLIVETGPEQRSTVGLYDVRELFEHAFTRYLENRGLKLSSRPKGDIPRLEVAIQDFTLDLSGSRWTARILYEAAISGNGRTSVRRYQGEGEKLRVSGLTQAHQVMSETFSDIIHQLNVSEMLSALAER